MDITAVSSALSALSAYGPYATGSVDQAVSIEMLDQTMEMNEAMNTQLVQMMEQSVTPHLGGNIDIRM
ncbi:MAG: YjfB family protein [Agathobacter sp.]